MNYNTYIDAAIQYIEENLQNPISLEDVAKVAGYSKYHFIGVFRQVLGMTPADYIRKRRISEIVRCMEHDDRPIFDIAFTYGFQSKENFTRAFKREHRILPTEFRYAQNSLKLYDRIYPQTAIPQVELVQMPSFRLVAYKCTEDTPPAFWNQYNAKGWSQTLSGGKIVEDFGVSDLQGAPGKMEYYIGIRETDALGDCTGTVTLEIQGGLYAIFHTPPTTHFYFVHTIHQTWAYITDTWLPQSGYARTGGYELESYVEASRLYSEKIYIPIYKSELEDLS